VNIIFKINVLKAKSEERGSLNLKPYFNGQSKINLRVEGWDFTPKSFNICVTTSFSSIRVPSTLFQATFSCPPSLVIPNSFIRL